MLKKIVVVVALLVMPGCVFAVNPVNSDKEPVAVDQIVGHWVSENKNGKTERMTIEVADRQEANRRLYRVRNDEEKGSGGQKKKPNDHFFISQVKERWFGNLIWVDEKSGRELYMIFEIDFSEKDRLTFHTLNQKKLIPLIEAKKIKGRIDEIEEEKVKVTTVFLTGSSEELAAILTETPREDIFKIPPATWRRVAPEEGRGEKAKANQEAPAK